MVLYQQFRQAGHGVMKRSLLLAIALLLLSGCGAIKNVMSLATGLVVPSTSDKILKSNLKEPVEVTEADMFGVSTVRKKEVVHKGPFKDLIAGIYVKPNVAEQPDDGGGRAPAGGSGGSAAKKPPKYELTAEVNLARYANADDIKKIFGRCTVKAALHYDEQHRTIEFPGGEAAFGGTCEPLKDPYDDVQKFFGRNKTFGYEIRYGFPTPFHIIRKEALPDLVDLTFTVSKELRASAADFEKSFRELGEIFPKTRISEKDNLSITPEIILRLAQQEAQQAEREKRKQAKPAEPLPDENEVERYAKGIVLDGGLFGDTDDLGQAVTKLGSYYNAYPDKSILLLAEHYLYIANDLIDDAENIILYNGQRKIDDFFHGSTIEELFESAWPDYYRRALEQTRGWIAKNTHYDSVELENQFFSRATTDKSLLKKKLLLDKPTFIEQHYPDVVIYLLTNNLIKPQNAVETRFLNTYNYYNGYDDDFAELHDFLPELHNFLLFNIY
jgi:hypothetical protein